MSPETSRTPLSRRVVRALVAVNAALVFAIGWVTLAPFATAQAEAPSRSPGQYMLVGGPVRSGNTNAVYVLDAANREMVALRWIDSRGRLEGIGYRNLETDLQQQPQR
jgi:hypothetical protein